MSVILEVWCKVHRLNSVSQLMSDKICSNAKITHLKTFTGFIREWVRLKSYVRPILTPCFPVRNNSNDITAANWCLWADLSWVRPVKWLSKVYRRETRDSDHKFYSLFGL